MTPILSLRRFVRLLGLAGAASFGSVFADEPAKGSRPPNILFLVSDNQRADTIHALGNGLIRTPNWDRLVRRGTTFTRAFSPNPLCIPSRAEIISGRSGFHNGVLPPYRLALELGPALWPETMRRAGYHTWHVGKWDTNGRPSKRGYEECQGLFSGGPVLPTRKDAKGRDITGYRGYVFQTDDGTLFPELGVGLNVEILPRLADAALSFIRRKPDQPFFLHVNFTAPHDPLLVPPDPAYKYDPATIPLPGNFMAQHPFDYGNFRGRDELLWPWPRTPEDTRDELALYYGVLTHLDHEIGRILGALEATGQAERTIVIFTSDHGLAIGSHGIRGMQNMYEHTVTVPLIIAGPGIPRNQRRHAQIYLRDLYPTICALAGVAFPSGLDGKNMAPVVRSETDEGHRFVFGHFNDVERMVRDDRWKLIEYPKVGREQLFHLIDDPLELHNLSDEPAYAAVRDSLRAELAAWQVRQKDPLLDSSRNASKRESASKR